jgi:hypothetical protein
MLPILQFVIYINIFFLNNSLELSDNFAADCTAVRNGSTYIRWPIE